MNENRKDDKLIKKINTYLHNIITISTHELTPITKLIIKEVRENDRCRQEDD